jgi:hypothetical protein
MVYCCTFPTVWQLIVVMMYEEGIGRNVVLAKQKMSVATASSNNVMYIADGKHKSQLSHSFGSSNAKAKGTPGAFQGLNLKLNCISTELVEC